MNKKKRMSKQPHVTPELATQMRQWSNLGHWAEGGLLGIVAILALIEAAGLLTGGWHYLWPGLLLAAGLLLPVVIFGHGHGAYEHMGGRGAIWQDPQQRQHLIMAGVLLIAGIAEILATAASIRSLSYIWPLGLVVIGVMFMVHTQHGTSDAAQKAIRVHRILGGTIVLAGLARGIQIGLEETSEVWSFAWGLLLFIVAIQLLIYREPAGIYESNEHGEH